MKSIFVIVSSVVLLFSICGIHCEDNDSYLLALKNSKEIDTMSGEKKHHQ